MNENIINLLQIASNDADLIAALPNYIDDRMLIVIYALSKITGLSQYGKIVRQKELKLSDGQIVFMMIVEVSE